MACLKQSNTRSSCKVINGQGAVRDHMFEYNQTLGKYRFGDVFVNTPSITYTGVYDLMIKSSDDSMALIDWPTMLGLDKDDRYPNIPNTLRLIEKGC